jgi:hypothetical protein
VFRVSPAQDHESRTSDDTAGMEMALRSDRRGGEGWAGGASWCRREWIIGESPNTDMTDEGIESEP